jgi:hypothetical protein
VGIGCSPIEGPSTISVTPSSLEMSVISLSPGRAGPVVDTATKTDGLGVPVRRLAPCRVTTFASTLATIVRQSHAGAITGHCFGEFVENKFIVSRRRNPHRARRGLLSNGDTVFPTS